MKAAAPLGFVALLERMPRRFVARFMRVEERARRRREAQARRFEQECRLGAEAGDGGQPEWQDTVAGFSARQGDRHGLA